MRLMKISIPTFLLFIFLDFERSRIVVLFAVTFTMPSVLNEGNFHFSLITCMGIPLMISRGMNDARQGML